MNEKTIKQAIEILNIQAKHIETIEKEHKDEQRAYTRGLCDMLELIISENYTNDLSIVFNPLDGTYSINGIK